MTHLVANYVRKQTLFAMLGAALLLLLLQISFAYLGELEDVNNGYRFFDALRYILWQSPRYLYELLPMAALVGSALGLGSLANNSELTVLRAAGVSLYRLVTWVIQSALLLILLAFLLNQFVLPYANTQAKRIKQPQHITRIGEMNGYWTRVDNRVVYVDYANATGDIRGLNVWEIDDASIRRLVSARTGVYLPEQNQWRLTDIKTIHIATDGRAERLNETSADTHLPINPNMIYLLTRPAEDLSVSQLYRYIRSMRAQGQQSAEHSLVFWQKLLSPLAVISLVLIACSFIFGSLRQQSMGLRLVLALMVGLSFRYIQDLMGFMSLAYQMPAIWFVLLPIVVSAMLGIFLLQRKR